MEAIFKVKHTPEKTVAITDDLGFNPTKFALGALFYFGDGL
jgi:hypothetical protein